jgi:hypothetical protein
MAQQKLWLPEAAVAAVAGNLALDKTIRVFLAPQGPHKAEMDKVEVAEMVLVVVVVEVAKMVVRAADFLAVTTVAFLGKMVTV